VADDEAAKPGTLAKNRIEALSDGIFAVAMTLLVLDIKLPDGVTFPTDGALFAHMVSLEHHFVIYLISFIVLGMYWVGHHLQFHYVRYVNHTLLWINLVFLFGVTSVPFATDLLGDHHQLSFPYVLYGALLLLLGGLLRGQLSYLQRFPDLASPLLTPEVKGRMRNRLTLFSIIPVISMITVFYNTRLALYIYFLLPIVHFLPGRIYEIAPPEQDSDHNDAPLP
jgi:uncharacterized membrane protein